MNLSNHLKLYKLEYILGFALVLIGILMRAFLYQEISLWQDELAMIYHSQRQYFIIKRYSLTNSLHFPMQYLSLKIWFQLFDLNVNSSRSLSYVLSLTTPLIPLFFSFKRIHKSAFVGVIFFSAVIFQWGHSVTGYALNLFLATLLFCSYVNYKSSLKNNILMVLLFVISALTSIHLFYITLSLIFFNILYHEKLGIKAKVIVLTTSILLALSFFSKTKVFRILTNPQENKFWSEQAIDLTGFWKSINGYYHNGFLFFVILFVTLFFIYLNSSKPNECKKTNIISLIAISGIFLKVIYSFNFYSLLYTKYFLVEFHLLLLGASFYIVNNFQSKNHKVKLMSITGAVLTMVTLGTQWTKEHVVNLQTVDQMFQYFTEKIDTPKLGYIGLNMRWYDLYVDQFKLRGRMYNIYDNGKCFNEDDLNSLNEFVDQGNNWLFYLDTDKCNMYVTKEALEKRGLSLKKKVDFTGIRLIQVVHK